MEGRFVILVGMMGAGKSTVGKLLALDLGVPFFDTDRLLERRLGRTIPQMFEIYGEEAFRKHETRVLRDLEPQEGILATGGGIVLSDDNWVEMRRLGRTVFLDMAPEALRTRLATAKKRRPLLETENWEERLDAIMQARRERYLLADIRVEINSDELADVVARVKEALAQ